MSMLCHRCLGVDETLGEIRNRGLTHACAICHDRADVLNTVSEEVYMRVVQRKNDARSHAAGQSRLQ